MWQKAANVAWWLGLSAYFGGIVAIAVIAPAVFHAVRDAHITMPGIYSPPLDVANQTGGEIFGSILAQFAWIELSALGTMLLGLIGMLFARILVRRSVWVLMLLWAILAAFLAYDAGVLRPAVVAKRTEVRQTAPAHLNDPADSAEKLWPQRAEFDRLHNRSTALARAKVYLLLAMLLVSAWRTNTPAKTALTRAELMRDEP